MKRILAIIIVFTCVAAPLEARKKITKPTARAVYHNNQGVTFLNKNDFERAEFEFKTAIELSPQYVEAYNNLGIVYKIQGKLGLAKQMFERAIKLDKKYAAAYSHLGAVLLTQGDVDGAIKQMKKGLKRDATIADIHYNLGLAYVEKTKRDKKSYIEEAEKELSIATELDPNLPHAHAVLAKVYYDTGEYEKAVIRYRLALGNEPKDVELWQALGQTYLAKGEPLLAQNCFQKALEMQPESKENHLGLGLFYLNEKRYEESINEFKAVVTLDPSSEVGWYRLGTAWLLRGDAAGSTSPKAKRYYAEAATALAKAKKINPQSADASYNLGLIYLKQGKKLDAQNEWEYTTSVQNKYAPALYNLANLYRGSGREGEALALYCRFLSASSGKYPTEEGVARQAIQSRGHKCRN
jgi:tetratricopeptide (TPR) repeat protein